ncbi:MAG: DUF4169 family protein [Pseudomonadota bacterium]
MSQPINLNRVRKDKARADKRARADANAVKHGRSKAERDADTAREAKAKRELDAHRREP